MTPLRTLILEDQPVDADLMLLHLERADFDPRWQRVETQRDFVAALGPELDLILADHCLPGYDALRALTRARECGVEAPFIIVSATIDQDLAVEAMREGAADFIIKDRLARLGPAVTRALERRRLRDAARLHEDLLRRVEIAAEDLRQIIPGFDALSALARELAATPEQRAALDSAEALARDHLDARLRAMADALGGMHTATAGPVPAADGPQGQRLRAGLLDTLAVLEQTKRSFKSRALARLRERLEALLRVEAR